MSLATAFAPAEAAYRGAVMRDTWGHLAPVPRRKYRGFLVFAFCDNGSIVVIKSDYKDLPDSPWLYEAEQGFVGARITGRTPHGAIWRFDGTVMMCKNGAFKFSGKTRRVKV